MPFLIGLFLPVFPKCMRPFNSLPLALAAAQPVLMGSVYCIIRASPACQRQ
ncbi:hypothetical protein BJM06_a00173 (plasmid) [Enterobacter cloacae]|nr:hypothetical protein BJM06_a00173 [Enterobacter cloacae]